MTAVLNNPAIGLYTRKRLWKLVSEDALDKSSAQLIEKVLAKTRPGSQAGWVWAMASALGASQEHAFLAASATEMLSGAIDIVDDVEDGDAQSWLPELSQAELVNLSVHLFTLAQLFIAEVDQVAEMGGELNAQAGRLISAMATGQYLEIKREEWDVASYERVAILTVGRQFALNFHLASAVANYDPASFLNFCDAL